MSIPEMENITSVLIVRKRDIWYGALWDDELSDQYLEAFRKLKAELRSTFAREEDLTFASLAKLPSLNAVIAERLRFCPPRSFGLSHVVPPADDTVYGAGYWEA